MSHTVDHLSGLCSRCTVSCITSTGLAQICRQPGCWETEHRLWVKCPRFLVYLSHLVSLWFHANYLPLAISFFICKMGIMVTQVSKQRVDGLPQTRCCPHAPQRTTQAGFVSIHPDYTTSVAAPVQGWEYLASSTGGTVGRIWGLMTSQSYFFPFSSTVSQNCLSLNEYDAATKWEELS